MQKVVCLLLILAKSSRAAVDVPSCVKNKITLSSALPKETRIPDLPDLPDVFNASVKVNATLANGPYLAQQYYDYPNNRAVLAYYRGTAYFAFSEGNIKYVKTDGSCMCAALANDNNKQFFGCVETEKNRFRLLPPLEAFHVSKANGLIYMGENSVRGVPVDHWRTCLSWDTFPSTNFTMDAYFSVKIWESAKGLRQIPIRIEVTSTKDFQSYGRLHNVYDYMTFQQGVEKESVFEVPEGTNCDCSGASYYIYHLQIL